MKNSLKALGLATVMGFSSCNSGYNDTLSGTQKKIKVDTVQVLEKNNLEYTIPVGKDNFEKLQKLVHNNCSGVEINSVLVWRFTDKNGNKVTVGVQNDDYNTNGGIISVDVTDVNDELIVGYEIGNGYVRGFLHNENYEKSNFEEMKASYGELLTKIGKYANGEDHAFIHPR